MFPSEDRSAEHSQRLAIALGVAGAVIPLLLILVRVQAWRMPARNGPFRQSDILGYDRATGATWVRCPRCDPLSSRYRATRALEKLDRGAGLVGAVRSASRGRFRHVDRRLHRSSGTRHGVCRYCQGKRYLTLVNPRITH